jgi:hypothetical protein
MIALLSKTITDSQIEIDKILRIVYIPRMSMLHGSISEQAFVRFQAGDLIERGFDNRLVAQPKNPYTLLGYGWNCSKITQTSQGRFMSRVEKKLKWTDEIFKRQIGTTKEVFLSMLGILEAAHIERHKLGGNPNGLSVGDKLLITLKYYRHYITMETIGDEFGRSKSTVCRCRRVECRHNWKWCAAVVVGNGSIDCEVGRLC